MEINETTLEELRQEVSSDLRNGSSALAPCIDRTPLLEKYRNSKEPFVPSEEDPTKTIEVYGFCMSPRFAESALATMTLPMVSYLLASEALRGIKERYSLKEGTEYILEVKRPVVREQELGSQPLDTGFVTLDVEIHFGVANAEPATL